MTRTPCARPGCTRAGAGTTDMLCHPHRRAAGLHRHDGNEAREHVRRCLDNGWTLTRIGDQAGLSDATIFRLMRSTDLITFDEVISNELMFFPDPESDLLEVNDENPPAGGKAFYRLEAELR